MISRAAEKPISISLCAGDEKTILDKYSESRVRECRCGKCLSPTGVNKETMVKKVQEEKMTIAKSTVANAAAEEEARSNRTHMGTSQHGVDVSTQPEVLDHFRERVSETDEFPQHDVSAREKQEVLEQLSRVSEQ